MPSDAVTVVVPTYNERENLAHLAAAVLLHGYRLLIVDDGSPDGTGAVADSLAAEFERVAVIHRTHKQGLGSAYVAGFDQALAEGAEIVIEMDADFSHNPEDLPRLVTAVREGADLAIGSRYVPGGATPDWPWYRRFVSRAGGTYARIMLDMPIRDATAGYRAFDFRALARLPYREVEASGYGFQVEMAWRACQAGLEIIEVPIVFRDREMGTSKMGPGIVLEAMWLVTRWGLSRIFGRTDGPRP